MANPTRFKKIATAGRAGKIAGQEAGATDPYIQTFVIPVTALAIGTVNTGVTLPANAQVTSATVNVLTAEVTAPTATLEVGTTPTGTANVIAASILTATGFTGVGLISNIQAEEVTYTVAVANFNELVAEIIIEVMASDGA